MALETPASIRWEPAERKKVVSAAVDAMASIPGLSLVRALCQGQENALPANRHRPRASLAINPEKSFGREIEAEIRHRQREQRKAAATASAPQAQPQPSKGSGFVQGIDKLTTDLADMFEALLHRKMMEKATSVYQSVLKEFETLISTPEPGVQLLGMSAEDIIRKAPKTAAAAKTTSKVAPSGKRKYAKRMDQVRGNSSAPPPPPSGPSENEDKGSPLSGGQGFSSGQVGGVPADGNGQEQSQQPPAG